MPTKKEYFTESNSIRIFNARGSTLRIYLSSNKDTLKADFENADKPSLVKFLREVAEELEKK